MNKNFKKDSFWVGGKFTVLEIIKNAKRKIHQIIVHEKNKKVLDEFNFKNIQVKIENDKFFDKLFKKDLDIHQGFAAEVEKLEKIDLISKINQLNNNGLFLILDGISDSRNIGSIIRTSAALNCDGILIEKKNYNYKNNLMFRSASGMTEVIDVIPIVNISSAIQILKRNNFWVYGMDAKGKKDIHELKFPSKVAFVFGSETNGIKNLVAKNCDEILKIKINKKTESLNISNAVSITLAFANVNKK